MSVIDENCAKLSMAYRELIRIYSTMKKAQSHGFSFTMDKYRICYIDNYLCLQEQIEKGKIFKRKSFITIIYAHSYGDYFIASTSEIEWWSFYHASECVLNCTKILVEQLLAIESSINPSNIISEMNEYKKDFEIAIKSLNIN